ncbi:hypothetical protein [Kingella denitrificans]|uniref:hypothetical protein n=1 Tax=Kingella denitrificans TaxID=502 RepID=UPI00288BCBB8|nr:hypothetical protein [Kingella denitrificans]
MSRTRPAELNDFIIPEFRGKKISDYEVRGDGKVVRKDRWETGIHCIRNLLVDAELLPDSAEFEITDVVRAVEKLMPEADE